MYSAYLIALRNSIYHNTCLNFAGIVFYQEFEGLALLNIFMFLFG